jgi:hypothetical protein
MDIKIKDIISKAIDRAANAVGVLTILVSLGFLGISSLFFGYKKGLLITLAVFGWSGAIEIFHRQAQSKLDQRSHLPKPDSLIHTIVDRNPTWKPLVIKEFTYDGFFFRAVGFEQYPMALGLAGPLCPRCKDEIVCLTEVSFPGRVKIVIKCTCGFSIKTNKTESELVKEASKLGNLPR